HRLRLRFRRHRRHRRAQRSAARRRPRPGAGHGLRDRRRCARRSGAAAKDRGGRTADGLRPSRVQSARSARRRPRPRRGVDHPPAVRLRRPAGAQLDSRATHLIKLRIFRLEDLTMIALMTLFALAGGFAVLCIVAAISITLLKLTFKVILLPLKLLVLPFVLVAVLVKLVLLFAFGVTLAA